MKSIIEEIEEKYRSNPLCGVQWSIDADAYDCNEIVEFGENESFIQGGMIHNIQDIIYKGKVVGYLYERKNGRLFDPMVVSFECSIKNDEDKNSPHYYEDEICLLRFATLQQFINHIKQRL